jgi:hypothetical protein
MRTKQKKQQRKAKELNIEFIRIMFADGEFIPTLKIGN